MGSDTKPKPQVRLGLRELTFSEGPACVGADLSAMQGLNGAVRPNGLAGTRSLRTPTYSIRTRSPVPFPATVINMYLK
jgi:hypothetical protein